MMMRFSLTLAALSLACAVLGGMAAADPTPRGMVPAADQPDWAAVGRLNITGQGFCTATLIAPDLVVTAAHCLMNVRTGRPVPPRDVHFLAGYRIGTFEGHRRGRQFSITPGFQGPGRTLPLDIALVQLDAPMPDTVAPIPLDTGVRATQGFTLLSYGMDRSQILSAQHGCTFEKRLSTVIVTTCEGVPGASGAPLLQMVDGKPVIVAVVSSILAKTRTPMAVGPVLAIEASFAHVARLKLGLSDAVFDKALAVVAPRVLK